MSADPLEELQSQKLRQRLWGATIIIALAVIFLPLLLDGSGSESQFRRVERLREEPPRVINVDGSRETVAVPLINQSDNETWWERTKRRFTELPDEEIRVRRTTDPDFPEASGNANTVSTTAATAAGNQPGSAASQDTAAAAPSSPAVSANAEATRFRAWVVQAGSFREEPNANAVRDRLRRAGYPSFVTSSRDGTVFRVRVGPMINKDQAGLVRSNVVDLLGREAIVVPYP
jgi:DedD protein